METKERNKDLFFTKNDLKRIFFRKKKSYIRLFKITFFAFLLFYFLQPTFYEATALFKQSSQNNSKNELLRTFLQSDLLELKQSGAQTVFESRTLLKKVAEKQGLQIKEKSSAFSFFYRLKDSLFAEFSCKTPDRKKFFFGNVFFEGKNSLNFSLQFTSENSFVVRNGKEAVVGELEKPLAFSGGFFTLHKIAPSVKIGKEYYFKMSPWMDVIKKMKTRLKIKPSKVDKNILALSFSSISQDESARVLNCLMSSYQDYLKEENEEIAHIHMKYLDQRGSELVQKYEKALTDHVSFLSQSLKNTGFISLKQEMDIIEKPTEEYLSRLYDVNLELSRLTSLKAREEADLKKLQKKKKTEIQGVSEEKAFSSLYKKSQETLLENDLDKERFSPNTELKKIEQLLCFFQVPNQFVFPESLPSGLSAEFLKNFQELQSTYLTYAHSDLKGDPLVYLQMQEKKQQMQPKAVLELERLKAQEVPLELEGISPETIQHLYVDYNQQLDTLRVSIEQLLDLQKQIPLEHFEISSLSGFLTDSVSQEMIAKASQKALEFQDKVNYSAKDIERIKASLQTQKRFLLQHIDQVVSMQKLRAELIREKIASLQKTAIHQLEIEKKLIQKQMSSLQERMQTFPEKWKRENELVMKRDLSLKMIEGLSQLTESKNIHHRLFQVESKPIDWAFAAHKPSKKGAFSFSFLAAITLMGGYFLKDFFKWLSQGTVLTEDFLAEKKILCCGSLQGQSRFSELSSEDLETLRKATTFLQEQGKREKAVISLLSSSHFSLFGSWIAKRLGLRGFRTLLIECSADLMNHAPQRIGLTEYLSGEVLEIIPYSEDGIDKISAGRYSKDLMDLLHTERFKQLLSTFSLKYDYILLLQKDRYTSDSFSALKMLASSLILLISEDITWESVISRSLQKPFAVIFSKSSGK